MKTISKLVVTTCALALTPHLYASSAVGILEGANGCPPGATDEVYPEPITIYMDDENHNNDSKITGWTGKTRRATELHFCRVTGEFFRPLASGDDYAVLKLSDSCPAGSVEFNRYFDNEDTKNNNHSSGDIYPNVVNSNTNLKFCYFKGADAAGPHTMSRFASFFDMPYGVFAPENFALSEESGTIYTDDEDNRNANGINVNGHEAIKNIISGGSDTLMHVHKVVREGEFDSIEYDLNLATLPAVLSDHVYKNELIQYTISAHAGEKVRAYMHNLSADADLRMKIGSEALRSDFDCESKRGDTKDDKCSVTLKKDAKVYISVDGYREADYDLVVDTIVDTIKE